MTEDLHRIRRFISGLVLRERALLLARVGLQVVLLGVMLELLAVAAASARWDRPAAAASLVGIAGIGLWLCAVWPLLTRWAPAGDALRQARRVEGLTPDLRGRLLTSVERTASARGHAGGPIGQESPAMVALVARRAVARVALVRPEAVHPVGAVARLAMATAAAAVFGLVVAVVSPSGLIGTARWWLAGTAAEAGVAGFVLGSDDPLARVGDLVLEYRYPDYTGLDPLVITNSTGDVHAPPGTTVRVLARSARPVEAAALVAYDEPALDAVVVEQREVAGTFTVRAHAGFYHLVTYRAGEPARSRDFSITPEPDLAPDVTLDVEADVLEVAADEAIEGTWRVKDDFGVSRVVLEVDGTPQPVALLAPRDRRVEVAGRLSTRPMDLGLQAGDRARMVVAAWDNDTYSGSKVGRSRVVEIVVLGPRGLDLRADERQEELRDLMLDVLADTLEEPWPAADDEGGIARWGERFAERYRPLDAAIEAWWPTLRDGSVEHVAVQEVSRAGRELVRYTQVSYLPESRKRLAADGLEVLDGLRDKCIVSLEDGILALDGLITNRALRHVAEDAEELARSAEALAEMMEGEPEAAEMLARLDRLEAQLEQLMESASKLEEGGLQEFVNQRTGEMESLVDEIRRAIAEGRMDDARELMAQLQKQVQQMSEGIRDELDAMVGEGNDLAQQGEDLEETLRQLEERQLALQEELGALRERADGAAAEEAEKLWDELARKTASLAEHGQEYVEGLDEAGRSFNETEVAREAAEQLAHLLESAEARDLHGVERSLRNAESGWARAEERLERESAMRRGSVEGPGRKEIGGVKREMEEVASMLERLQQLSERVSSGTRQDMRQLRGKQQGLQGELQEAQKTAQEWARQSPVQPHGLEEGLQQADEQMSQAGDDLGSGQPMEAEGAMGQSGQRIRDARESLRQAMEQAKQQAQELQQSGEGGREGEGGEPGAGKEDGDRPDRRAMVELPSPEEFQTPEEYRRALLEGMEGDVPEEYRALKKRYYEELVHQ